MKLYHVSLDPWNGDTKLFVPRVPADLNEDLSEDKVTPRICFSTEPALCLQAIQATFRVGTPITVFTVILDRRDQDLVSPQRLTKTGAVPDALENNEYWYLKPITVQGSKQIITDFSREFDIAWTALKAHDVLRIAIALALEYNVIERFRWEEIVGGSAREVYNSFLGQLPFVGLNEAVCYAIEDEIWDRVAELPWAQLKRISNLVSKPVTTGCNYGLVAHNSQGLYRVSGDPVQTFSTKGDCITAASKFQYAVIYDYVRYTYATSDDHFMQWKSCNIE